MYKADECRESGNAEPITWTARKSSDSTEETIIYILLHAEAGCSDCSKALTEGDYNISKEIEGNGNVYVRDMVSETRKQQNEGERSCICIAEKDGH